MDRPALLRGGRLFVAGRLETADVLVENGRVAKVGPSLCRPGAAEMDLAGLVLSPGFVDLHTHLREPGFSQKETMATGTRAAAAGGFTTLCAMPNLAPVPDSPARLEAELALIRTDALVEVLPIGAITRGQAGAEAADIEALAPLCAGFSDDGRGVQPEELMRGAMARIAAAGGLVMAHCEDEALLTPGGCVHGGEAARRLGLRGISGESEWRQLARDLALVRETGVRYHMCHVSTRESVALIRRAKAEGLPVTCECTPHHLALSEEDIREDHGRFKMNPPLRSRADREALVEGLLDGAIDCIATDHAPHTGEEKARGLGGSAFGVTGLETAFAACHTALVVSGLCGLAFLLDKLTRGPARVLGRSGDIREGGWADLTALDPARRWRVDPARFFSKGRSTPFAGRVLTGAVAATWRRGEMIYDGRDAR